MKDNKEVKIVSQLIDGDEKAVDWIVSNYRLRLLNFIQQSLPKEEDVESLVQEVFLIIWNKRKTLKQDASLEAFIFTVARNLMIDHMRKLIRQRKYIEETIASSQDIDDSTVESIEYKEVEQQVFKCIEELPAKGREIFMLNKMEGMSYKAIAQMLGISEHTVNAHMYNSTKILKKNLKELICLLIVLLAAG